MPLLKKTFIWLFFAVAMYFGGSTTQSSSNFLQGMGFVSIMLAFACLFVLYKLLWSPMSQLMRLITIVAVLWYCSFSLGLFNGNSVSSLISGGGKSQPEVKTVTDNPKSDIETLGEEMFGVETTSDEPRQSTENQNNDNNQLQKIAENGGLVGQVKDLLFGRNPENEQKQTMPTTINPFDYPSTKGYPRVITGSLLGLNGLKIKLFGIDAPDRNQTCADHFGNSYSCGSEAVLWLQNWLGEREVTCYILGDIQNSWATGTCFVEEAKYDIAAVVANAGWAVAYTQNTKVYVPYEQQARTNRRGLWQGTFYKPWDWRRIQNRKVEIKIKEPRPKKKTQSGKKGGFDFWGLF